MDKIILKDITKSLQSEDSPIQKRSARVMMGSYNNKTDCLFRGQSIVKGKHGHDLSASEFKTSSSPQTVLGHCETRADD